MTHWSPWSFTTSFGHCRELWQRVEAGTTGSNTGSAWRTEQRSVATDKPLSESPLQRYTLLTANTLRVNQLSFDTVAPRESLCDTLPELEAFEVNDLLMITQAITAVRNNCEDLKNTIR